MAKCLYLWKEKTYVGKIEKNGLTEIGCVWNLVCYFTTISNLLTILFHCFPEGITFFCLICLVFSQGFWWRSSLYLECLTTFFRDLEPCQNCASDNAQRSQSPSRNWDTGLGACWQNLLILAGRRKYGRSREVVCGGVKNNHNVDRGQSIHIYRIVIGTNSSLKLGKKCCNYSILYWMVGI